MNDFGKLLQQKNAVVFSEYDSDNVKRKTDSLTFTQMRKLFITFAIVM